MERQLIIGTFALAATLAASAQDEATPSFKSVDSIEARVQGCVTCHGQSGQGTQNGYHPRIAGKPARYLYNQLIAFRDGTRKYPPMNYLVAYLPDAYLKEMADHFAKQRPAFAPKRCRSRCGDDRARQGHRDRGDPARAIRHASHAMAPPPDGAGNPGWSAFDPRTSPRSSRAGAWATAAPPTPIA
jgi:cytochrome c553